jgi:hypothetical protein
MQALSRIKLLPSQIPIYWEVIKYIIVTVDEVDEKNLQPYLNELLHALLNEKAQCFVELSESRNIIGVCITKFMVDKVTGEKYLYIQNAYSFRSADNESRKKSIDFLKDFARKEHCTYMTFQSRNRRVWEIGEISGFKEKARIYEFRLGDRL